MKVVRLKWKNTAEESVIICRKNALKSLGQTLQSSNIRAFVFTDTNVLSLYGRKLKRTLPDVPVFAMEAGEEHKNEGTLFSLLAAMAKAELNRNSVLIALGGGVVGDVGGLAASLYMRGISCIQVPTTLLAQVDSSVGGKTAIDFCGVKNLVGAFHQPTRVYVDPDFLKTLPMREIQCGLGEIVKHAALDKELFEELTSREVFDLEFLGKIVPKNIEIKAAVVRKDPQEEGLRRCLNLGHTTAHAIELNEGTLSHGACVLLGIVYEARIARNHVPCDKSYLDELEGLCRRILSCDISSFDVSSYAQSSILDKKNTGKGIKLVVPTFKGEYAEIELSLTEYTRELTRIRGELC